MIDNQNDKIAKLKSLYGNTLNIRFLELDKLQKEYYIKTVRKKKRRKRKWQKSAVYVKKYITQNIQIVNIVPNYARNLRKRIIELNTRKKIKNILEIICENIENASQAPVWAPYASGASSKI